MALTVSHRFISAISDDTNTSLVRPSDWNTTHVISADPLSVLGVSLSGTTVVAPIVANSAGQVLQATNATTIAFATVPSPTPSGGGTGSQFWAVTGPASSIKTFTFPNSSQTVAMLDEHNQTVSGGAVVVPFSLGTTANGSAITLNFGSSPLQYVAWNGTGTFSAATVDGSCMVLLTNGATANSITFTGFSVPTVPGDTLVTTNGSAFTISFWRINSKSGYRVAAMG